MRVAITGSNGLIGSALAERLERGGHTVVRIVRNAPGAGEVSWDPLAGRLDAGKLEGVDAVVHLAGVGIADKRWTEAHRARVLQSRLAGTSLMARTVAAMAPAPALLSASAIGFYGDRGSQRLGEASGPGQGFLADVCVQWEQATGPADAAGVRVLHLRTGIVLTPEGGALKKQLPLFRAGVAGKLGSGEQFLSWISLDDEVGAIEFLLTDSTLRGPVNLTAPGAVTNAEFTRALGRAVRRPAVIPVPAFALRAVMGTQMADEMLLSGANVAPLALEEAGYRFAHPTLADALRSLLG